MKRERVIQLHLPVQVCCEQWHRDLLLIKRLDDDLSYVSLCLCNLVLFRDFFFNS